MTLAALLLAPSPDGVADVVARRFTPTHTEIDCPFCGRVHRHGYATVGSMKVSHCFPGGSYRMAAIVDVKKRGRR